MNILLYPGFRTEEELADIYGRCCWYIPDMREANVIFPVCGFRVPEKLNMPEYFGVQCEPEFRASFVEYSENAELMKLYYSADFILVWNENMNKMEKHNLGAVSKRILEVDRTSELSRYEAYHFAILRHELMSHQEQAAIKEECYHKLLKLKPELESEKAYVFGTGPSLAESFNFDFKDGLRIVCNGIMKNEKLLEHINPHILIGTDPALHYGVSKYAARFRERLVAAMEKYGACLFVTMGYYPLIIKHYPHLKDRIIGVPTVPPKVENISLEFDKKFQVACYANVLTLFLLPLGTTFAREINILGCDGRESEVVSSGDNPSPFWKHHSESEFEDVYNTLKEAHPSFFMLDYEDWYEGHCANTEKLIQRGLEMGKRFKCLTTTYIPVLIPFLPETLRAEIEKRLESVPQLKREYDIFVSTRKHEKFKVSIILSLYNCARFIVPGLRNLLNQSLYRSGDAEIIMIDSASPGNEYSLVRPYLEEYPNLIYARTSERETVYQAFNRAIKLSRGEYIMNYDTDNRIRHNCLEMFVEYLESHPGKGAVYGNQYVGYHENESFNNFVSFGYLKRPDFSYSMLLHKFYFGSEMMWRKSLYEKAGFYENDYIVAGDYEMACRMCTQSEFGHLDKFFGIYLKNLKGVEYTNLELCSREDEKVRGIYKDKFPPKVDPPRVHVHFPMSEKCPDDYITIICHTNCYDRTVTPYIEKLFFDLEYPHIIYSIDTNSSQETKDSITHLREEGILADSTALSKEFLGCFESEFSSFPQIAFYVAGYGSGVSLDRDFLSADRHMLTENFLKAHRELTGPFLDKDGFVDPSKVKVLTDLHEYTRFNMSAHKQRRFFCAEPLVKRGQNDITVIIQHFCPTGQESLYGKALNDCISSIRRQVGFDDCTVIVCDDGSSYTSAAATDANFQGIFIHGKDSLKNLSGFPEIDADYYFYKSRTGCFSKALMWNCASEIAPTEKLVFLDDDHFFKKDNALCLYSKLLEEYDLVTGHTEVYNCVTESFLSVENKKTVKHELGFNIATVQGSNFGIWKKVLKRVGYFAERSFWWGTGDDPDLFWKLYLELRPSSPEASKKACYVEELITENSCSGRWQAGCLGSKGLFIKDFLNIHGVHPYANASRNRAAWMTLVSEGNIRQDQIAQNMKTFGVSIVIPAWNSTDQELTKTICSVASIGGNLFEIVILVKRGRKSEYEIFADLFGCKEKIKIIETVENIPYYKILSTGMKRNGQFIGVIFPSVLIFQEAESRLGAAIQSNPAPEIITGGHVLKKADGSTEYIKPNQDIFNDKCELIRKWNESAFFLINKEYLKKKCGKRRFMGSLEFLLKFCPKDIMVIDDLLSGSQVDKEREFQVLKKRKLLTGKFLKGKELTTTLWMEREEGSKDKKLQPASSWKHVVWWNYVSQREHFALLIMRLAKSGIRKIALYGKGLHTERLLNSFSFPPALKVVCIFDDFNHGQMINGVPVLNPRSEKLPDFDAVVISSDTIEEKLRKNALNHGFKNIYTIYSSNHDLSLKREKGKVLCSRLREDRVKVIALYGAGLHTHVLLQNSDIFEGIKVLCILDDMPSLKHINGVSIFAPNDPSKPDFDAVVISSDTVESMLYDKAVSHGFSKVYRLYS